MYFYLNIYIYIYTEIDRKIDRQAARTHLDSPAPRRPSEEQLCNDFANEKWFMDDGVLHVEGSFKVLSRGGFSSP